MSSICMQYFICTACKKELDENNAVYFPYCSHVYCVDCTEVEIHCPCDPSSVRRKFADDPIQLAIFRTKRALEKVSVNEGISSELWAELLAEYQKLSIKSTNGDVDDDDVEIIPAEEVESHKVQLVKCQLETVKQLYKEHGSNLQCNFQVAAGRYLR